MQDIAEIDTSKVDIREVNDTMYRVIRDVRYALSLSSSVHADTTFMLSQLLEVYISTHKSVMLLMNENLSDPVMAADAMSIVREQVEKLYVIGLLIHNPERWVTQYLRADYRAKYEDHLREKRDYGQLPRVQKSFPKTLAELEKIRLPPRKDGKRGHYIIVSERMKKCIKNKFCYPDAASRPRYYNGKEFNAYFRFPTPGGARDIVDQPIKKLLNLWYPDYQVLCRYSHVHMEKVFLQAMSEYKNYFYYKERVQPARQRIIERGAFISVTSAASACALVSLVIKKDLGCIDFLREFWATLTSVSLPARRMWEKSINELLTR